MVTVRLLYQVNWSERGLEDGAGTASSHGSGHGLGARLPGSTVGFITPSWVVLEAT